MKYHFTLLIITFLSLTAFGQDVIILKDGTELKGKVTELGLKNVKYSNYKDSIQVFSELSKSEVFMILFESGRREIFAEVKQLSFSQSNQQLQRIRRRIYLNGKFLYGSELEYVMGKDLYNEYSKTKTSVSISNALIFGGFGMVVIQGLTTLIASEVYSSELYRYQYYYLQGHSWSAGNDYSLNENLSNLKTASDVLKVSEPLFLVGAACFSFGLVFRITSYNKMDKVLNIYNASK